MTHQTKTVFSDAQLMMLQLVNEDYTEKELSELRQLLVSFNHTKMQNNLNETVSQKNYNDQDFQKIVMGHDRKST